MESNDWKAIIAEWRKLTAEEQLRIRLSRIPRKVARSMAFEDEPVDEKMLEELLHCSTGRLPESTGTFRDTSGTADSNAAASHNREDARLIGSMTKDEEQQQDNDDECQSHNHGEVKVYAGPARRVPAPAGMNRIRPR